LPSSLLSTTRKEYTARKEIHSPRKGAKKGGHTKEKRLHKKSKA
jgi:hypothetical protein